MADQHRLPLYPSFAPPPAGTPPEVARVIEQTQQSMRDLHRTLAERIESLITVGTIAQRPPADGSFRFYFATDETPPVLYFDDGIWNAANAT